MEAREIFWPRKTKLKTHFKQDFTSNSIHLPASQDPDNRSHQLSTLKQDGSAKGYHLRNTQFSQWLQNLSHGFTMTQMQNVAKTRVVAHAERLLPDTCRTNHSTFREEFQSQYKLEMAMCSRRGQVSLTLTTSLFKSRADKHQRCVHFSF